MDRPINIAHQRYSEILKGVDVEEHPHWLTKCPFCGATEKIFRDVLNSESEFSLEEDLDGNRNESLVPDDRVPVKCESCGKLWYEIFELREVYVLKKLWVTGL